MITSIECYYVHSSETFHTFHKMFYNMLQIIFEYSLDFSRIFPGMFGDIQRNVWRHSPEYLATFSGMFGDIPRNVWGHSPEYNILPIHRVPRIPFPVPVFLVLYIANILLHLHSFFYKNNFIRTRTSYLTKS